MTELLSKHQVKFVIAVLLIIAVMPLMSSSDSPPSSKPVPEELEYKGAVLAHIHRTGHGYGSTYSKDMHSHIEDIGFDTVQLNTFAYMRSRKETEVISGRDPTMARRYMVAEIENLHEAGLKVMLKPHIWIGGHNLDADNWRNKIDFDDPAEEKSVVFELHRVYPLRG